METKDLLAASLLLMAGCGGLIAACVSYWARAFLFMFMVSAVVFIDYMAVEFFSIYWYRGTTRGFEITLLDIVALSVLVGSLVSPRHPFPRWFWPAGIGLMVLLVLYAAATITLAEPRITGLFELTKMLRGVLVLAAAAAFVRTERELRMFVFALGAAVWLEAIVALKQRYITGMDRVPGTVAHPNSLSMYLCMATPVLAAAALSRWPAWLRAWAGLAVGAGAVGVLLTVSRAGIPIFVVTMLGVVLWCSDFRITFRKIAVMAVALLVGGILVQQSWDTIAARYAQATLEDEYMDARKEGRGIYLRWAKQIVDDRFLGVGLNNWSYYVSRDYGHRLGFYYEDYGDFSREPLEQPIAAAPAHNLFALTAGELGIPGLIIFTLLWLRWLQLGAAFLWRKLDDPMHRLGVGLFFGTCGILLQSMTEWTYRQTVIFFTFNVLLGVLASLTWFRRHAAPAYAARVANVEADYPPSAVPVAGRW